jgi:transposase
MNTTKEHQIILEGRKGRQFIIDLEDPIQRRYELIRELKLSDRPKEEICGEFDYSRVMGHLYEKAWDEKRWEGLNDKKKGPKTKSKRTDAVEQRVLNIRFHQPDKDMYEIADMLINEGYDISPRTVARILADHGVTLKKTRQKR